MRNLGVYYRREAVGVVSADDGGRFSFAYHRDWLGRPEAFAISQTLPLAEEPRVGEAAHAFFANLLPEGRVRTLVARRLGISEGNDFELLAALGGECAGALVLAESPPLPEEAAYRPLAEDELARLAKTGAVFAETSGTGGVRLSLAGAQDKLPVLERDGRLFLPLGSSPSSHILKFENRDFRHLPANEAFVTGLARSCGLPVVESDLRRLGRGRHLLVARYDRQRAPDGAVTRLHQEDFCQALGLPPSRKYEAEGGPTFARCFRLVAECSSEPAPDLRALLHWLAFTALVGNSDGHAKNLSLIRTESGDLQLAPFYDLVCTSAYPRIDRRLAVKVGAESDPGRIRGRDWRALGEEIGVRPKFVVDTVRALAERLLSGLRDATDRFRERYGRSAALDMIVPRLRKQVRRTLQLLDQ